MYSIKALALAVPLFLILTACENSSPSKKLTPPIDSQANRGDASVDSDESWQSGTQENSSIDINVPDNSNSLAIDSDVNWSLGKDIESGEVVTGKPSNHHGSTPSQAIDSDSNW